MEKSENDRPTMVVFSLIHAADTATTQQMLPSVILEKY